MPSKLLQDHLLGEFAVASDNFAQQKLKSMLEELETFLGRYLQLMARLVGVMATRYFNSLYLFNKAF